jgi:hypothetical protein
MTPYRAKSPTRFIRFRALPAGEVTLLILQRLSLRWEESRAMAVPPRWPLPPGHIAEPNLGAAHCYDDQAAQGDHCMLAGASRSSRRSS